MLSNNLHLFTFRHAPTQWNKEHRLQGNQDTDIIAEGLDEYLQRIQVDIIPKPDIIITSGLKRTKQTAAGLIKRRGWEDVAVEEDARFNERSWGVLEGKTRDEAVEILLQDEVVVAQFPQLATVKNPSIVWDQDEFRYPTVETIHELKFRVEGAVRILAQRYLGKRIVLVTHAGVLLSLGLNHAEVSQVAVDMNGKITPHA